MTLALWWSKLRYFLSGRAGFERTIEPVDLPPIDLPPIETPTVSQPIDGAEKEYLEQRRRRHEDELARLRVKAHVWRSGRRDT